MECQCSERSDRPMSASKEKGASPELEKEANPEVLERGTISEMLHKVDNLTKFEL